eukprot:144460-Alexandrium_andersonii.AAC.1
MASYAPLAMPPRGRPIAPLQRRTRRSSSAMPDSVRFRNHASARRSTASAPRKKAGGPLQRPARHTAAPAAAAT